jgi:hypothetical protein
VLVRVGLAIVVRVYVVLARMVLVRVVLVRVVPVPVVLVPAIQAILIFFEDLLQDWGELNRPSVSNYSETRFRPQCLRIVVGVEIQQDFGAYPILSA